MSFGRKLFWLTALTGIVVFVIFVWAVIDVMTDTHSDIQVFTAGDGVLVTADSYLVHNAATTPLIVLFHQENWSRGEFIEIAPRLNQMGYNCLAVDLRAGDTINGIENLTAKRARELGKHVKYSDALFDMITALNFVKRKYNPSKLVVLGSSYSADLVLKVAGDYPGLIDGVMAFSPGDYIVQNRIPLDWITSSAAKITVPVLFVSAEAETIRWVGIYQAIASESKLYYAPAKDGKHGARSLWNDFGDNRGYWMAVETFLKRYF